MGDLPSFIDIADELKGSVFTAEQAISIAVEVYNPLMKEIKELRKRLEQQENRKFSFDTRPD